MTLIFRRWLPWALGLMAAATLGCQSTRGVPTLKTHPIGTARTHTLFLNYDEVTLHGGVADATGNATPLLNTQLRLKAYLTDDPQRAARLDALTEEVRGVLAPYDIDVTASRPGAGPYAMIVFTDEAGLRFGCDFCLSLTPSSCNTTDSPIAFVFGGAIPGVGQSRHAAASQAISMFGMFAGIPATARGGDCMCYSDAVCLNALQETACSIGGLDTPVATALSCPTTLTTLDEHATFLRTFGPR